MGVHSSSENVGSHSGGCPTCCHRTRLSTSFYKSFGLPSLRVWKAKMEKDKAKMEKDMTSLKPKLYPKDIDTWTEEDWDTCTEEEWLLHCKTEQLTEITEEIDRRLRERAVQKIFRLYAEELPMCEKLGTFDPEALSRALKERDALAKLEEVRSPGPKRTT